jgi:hypothetical protein
MKSSLHIHIWEESKIWWWSTSRYNSLTPAKLAAGANARESTECAYLPVLTAELCLLDFWDKKILHNKWYLRRRQPNLHLSLVSVKDHTRKTTGLFFYIFFEKNRRWLLGFWVALFSSYFKAKQVYYHRSRRLLVPIIHHTTLALPWKEERLPVYALLV